MNIGMIVWEFFKRLVGLRAVDNQLEAHESARDDFDSLTSHLQEELKRLSERVERTEATADSNRQTVEVLRRDVYDLRRENTELRDKLARCEQRHDGDQVRIVELESKCRQSSEQIAELERKLAGMPGGDV